MSLVRPRTSAFKRLAKAAVSGRSRVLPRRAGRAGCSATGRGVAEWAASVDVDCSEQRRRPRDTGRAWTVKGLAKDWAEQQCRAWGLDAVRILARGWKHSFRARSVGRLGNRSGPPARFLFRLSLIAQRHVNRHGKRHAGSTSVMATSQKYFPTPRRLTGSMGSPSTTFLFGSRRAVRRQDPQLP